MLQSAWLLILAKWLSTLTEWFGVRSLGRVSTWFTGSWSSRCCSSSLLFQQEGVPWLWSITTRSQSRKYVLSFSELMPRITCPMGPSGTQGLSTRRVWAYGLSKWTPLIQQWRRNIRDLLLLRFPAPIALPIDRHSRSQWSNEKAALDSLQVESSSLPMILMALAPCSQICSPKRSSLFPCFPILPARHAPPLLVSLMIIHLRRDGIMLLAVA